MNKQPNAQYNLAAPNSLAVKLSTLMRRRMFLRFLELSCIEPHHTIIDIGVTSDQSYESSNYLEAWYPYKNKITAIGLDNAMFLEKLHPGLVFVKADGRCLPFKDNQFDYSHSSAVIEHIGGNDSQMKFIAELYRVARKGIFLTTPNRWFPVEFHTVLPFVHWLPKRQFRSLMRIINMDFFSLEDNLNLLTKSDIRNICDKIGIQDVTIDGVKLGGWTSNLIIYIRK